MFVSTDGVFNHRGRVLGGSSAINGGFYTHASNEYVARAGWDPQLVKESYEWVERKMAFRPRLLSWQAAARDGLVASRGVTGQWIHVRSFGRDQNWGYDPWWKWVRHSTVDLLEYAHPTNITVYLHAEVHQILFRTAPGQYLSQISENVKSYSFDPRKIFI